MYKKIVSLLFVCLFLISCQSSKKIHIYGRGFPDIPGANVFIASIEKRIQLKNGKFDLRLDSVKEGRFAVSVTLPGYKPDTLYSRDKLGKIKTRYKDSTGVSILKYFYINPKQALSYYITPSKKITEELINDYKVQRDQFRTNQFRLSASSKSEDARLFEKFNTLEAYYEKYCRYRILDSLYKNSNIVDKIYSDFGDEAMNLNKKNNFPTYHKNIKAIIRANLDNPVSVLQILNLTKEDFEKDAEYSLLLNSMSGRAIKSPYFAQAKLKFNLQNNDKLLSVGNYFVFPAGFDPDYKKVNYDFSHHTYTLVEFWASWCIPCRKKNPEWNEIISKYKEKGFQVLGISLDENIGQWRAAILKDKLVDWIHISDLENGFNGTNALQYGIKEIPLNVLIDSTGKIIMKNVKPSDLQNFLSEVLNK